MLQGGLDIGLFDVFSRLSGRKKKASKEELAAEQRKMTANEFVNVQDIRGNFLYTKDKTIFCYIKIHPVSLDLLSKAEKKKKIRTFSAEFASEREDFKLFSISRPVDISGLTNNLQNLLAGATDHVQKKLLYNEIREMSTIALNGEVIERQFFMIIWCSAAAENPESALNRRAMELQNKFRSCDIGTEIAGQETIIQLCNLFANPAYVHLEDTQYEPTIPFLS